MTRRRIVLLTIPVLNVLLIVAGIYLFQTYLFFGETRPIPNTPHRFLIQSGVTEADLVPVEQGITLANQYFLTHFGAALPNPIEVRMARSTRCAPSIPLGSGSTAVADEEMMCIDTTGYVWTQILPHEPLVGISIIAHEHFHNLQGQLGCLPGPNDHEYAWWVEGSATFVGWHTLIDAGLVTEADVLETMHKWGGFDDDLELLASYERSIRGDPEYALAYRAIADLVERSGEASLYTFCQQIGQGTNWHSAFESAYGVSVEDFYAVFENQRNGDT